MMRWCSPISARVRDYCFLDDIVEGIVLAASVPSPGFDTFNLGSGVGTSVGDLAELALRLGGRRLPIRSDPSRRRPAAADIDHLVADRTRAQSMLGWSPAVTLEDGLARTLRWMEAKR